MRHKIPFYIRNVFQEPIKLYLNFSIISVDQYLIPNFKSCGKQY